jgi:hypothetical protein
MEIYDGPNLTFMRSAAPPIRHFIRCSADADRRKADLEGQYLSARQLPPTNWKIWIGIGGEHDG